MRKTSKKEAARTERYIPLEQIVEPELAMRESVDDETLGPLCESISKVGLISPIVVIKKGRVYEIVAGHRRFVAHRRLNLAAIRSVVIEGRGGLAEAIKRDENFVREKVSEYDESVYLTKLMARDGLKQKEMAKLFGCSEGYISERLKIARWPDALQMAIREGSLVFSTARELARIENDAVRRDYIRHAIQNGATPALAKQWADDANRAMETVEEVREAMAAAGGAGPAEYPQFPCWVCDRPHDVRELVAVRVCGPCKEQVEKQKSAQMDLPEVTEADPSDG